MFSPSVDDSNRGLRLEGLSGFANGEAGAVAACPLETGLYSAEALAEHRRVRELLIQSRELLTQMQAGYTGELHGA